jgi:purine-binding chemotaxis protein CheW
MNLRGSVIPIIDLAGRLGMGANPGNERCAIVVADVDSTMIGFVVDRVSDILTIDEKQIQPVPKIAVGFDTKFARGVIAQAETMTCFLDFSAMFAGNGSIADGFEDDLLFAASH